MLKRELISISDKLYIKVGTQVNFLIFIIDKKIAWPPGEKFRFVSSQMFT